MVIIVWNSLSIQNEWENKKGRKMKWKKPFEIAGKSILSLENMGEEKKLLI